MRIPFSPAGQNGCSQPAGYLVASCSADCKDNNPHAGATCDYAFFKSSEPWSKVWSFGTCESHTWPVCDTGFHVTSCFAQKVSGGGVASLVGFSGTSCTLQVCDLGFESATVYPSGNCAAD